MSFHPADIAVILLYVAAILYIGFVVSKKKESGDTSSAADFILAGRKVTLPFFIGTLVATWYGSILGVGEFVYTSGIVGWVCFGFPYYIAAALFAVLLAGKIREAPAHTIPEQVKNTYGSRAGWISSLIVLVITIPAAYILMLGVVVNLFSGWPLWLAILIGAVISLIYLYKGGFRADVLTNMAQFVLMYAGFGALLFFAVKDFGSFGVMAGKLPESHTKPFGGLSWQYIIAWYIISFQTFVDPSFHQRCAAAESPKTAKNGILISILFWAVFDFFTLFAGLYAKAFFEIDNPLMAYPILGEALLPPVWKGIFTVALLATIMSTLDSYAFISAATIGNDILKPLGKKIKIFAGKSTKTLTQAGLIISGTAGVIMAIALPSAVDLIYYTSSIAVPGLLIPLSVSFSGRLKLLPGHAVLIMVASSSASAIWLIISKINESLGIELFNFFALYEPMLPGIFVSILLSLIFIRYKRPKG
ncbi:MAG: sodium:solute symporter [Candidatus Kapaibacterium sp.]